MSHVRVDLFNPFTVRKPVRCLCIAVGWAVDSLVKFTREPPTVPANYKLVGLTSPHPLPPTLHPYIALGLAALRNHGYNGGMGLQTPPQKQPANPLWRRSQRKTFGVTGQGRRRRPDNEPTPDTRQHPITLHQPQRHPPREEPAIIQRGVRKSPRPDIGPPLHPRPQAVACNQAAVPLCVYLLCLFPNTTFPELAAH